MHIKQWLAGFACVVVGSVSCFGPYTRFSTRPQGANLARELAGLQRHMNRHKASRWNCVAEATIEYGQSFDNEKIADSLFGGNSLTFSGSRAINRNQKTDILADYFGLPSDFKSCVCIDPKISNIVADIGLYSALDTCFGHLYVRAHLPIVRTSWDLNWCESVKERGTAFHPAGYLGSERIERDAMPASAFRALQGGKAFGDLRVPLQFGKISSKQSKTRLADVHVTVGLDCVQSDWYHFGLSAYMSAPTGNTPNGEFLFDPIAGNGHHWQLGGGISGHVELFKTDCRLPQKECKKESFFDRLAFWRKQIVPEQCKEVASYNPHTLGLYVDANISHLFCDEQKRSFDFTKGGCGSRYMLLERMGGPAVNLFTPEEPPVGTLAPDQYQGELVHAINHTTFRTNVSISVQADVVAKLVYRYKNWECDLGYNLWARSKEKITRKSCLPSNTFAIKGDAMVYGFDVNAPVTLGTTQSCATIYAGQNDRNGDFTNANADSSIAAAEGAGILLELNQDDFADLGLAPVGAQTSRPAILLKDSDLNLDSALLPHAVSHTIFVHGMYTWDKGEQLNPFVGAGASAEWACSCVGENSAHSQWRLWIKGGFAY